MTRKSALTYREEKKVGLKGLNVILTVTDANDFWKLVSSWKPE